MATFELPEAARQRLAQNGPGQRSFSAHFGVNELLLLARNGYEPVGQVLGASVFQTGIQWTRGGWRDSERQAAVAKGISYELTQSTAAFYQARSLAMQRMQEEAHLLGASLVIGARIERHIRDTQENSNSEVWEFYARGTGLRRIGQNSKPATPVLCSLNAAEVCQLEAAGYRPAGIVTGNCYWHHTPNQASSLLLTTTNWSQAGRTNQEMTDITNAVYQAREIAMSRLEKEARDLKADGVLGLEVDADFSSQSYSSSGNTGRNVRYMTIPASVHFFAIGTAVYGRGNNATSNVTTTVQLDS